MYLCKFRIMPNALFDDILDGLDIMIGNTLHLR